MIQRVRYIGDETVILDTDFVTDFVNAQIVSEITAEIAKDSLYEYIEDVMGLRITSANKEITCQSVSELNEQFLDLYGYNMVVNVESVTYLDE